MSELIIEAHDLEKQYLKQLAVKKANFTVSKGMICGLIGPNGAGKTTIMKMLGGLVLPTGGSLSLMGKSDEKGLCDARRSMSFIIETPYAKEAMSARENLMKQCIQKGISDKSRIDEALKTVGLADTGKKPVKNFSLGMRQRLGIANAIISKPSVMVLDEPINGLDPEGIIEIRELLLRLNREEGTTIIISSHILSELSLLCTDFIFITKGTILRSLSAEELKRECQSFFRISTDNDVLAEEILKKRGIKAIERDSEGLRLFEERDNIRAVSLALYEGGAVPLAMYPVEADLEEYYMRLTGGGENEAADKGA